MTDTPTPPAATGSQAQEREALGQDVYMALYSKDGAAWAANDTKDFWYWLADILIAAGWTRCPSGAGDCDHTWSSPKLGEPPVFCTKCLAPKVVHQAALSLRGDAETDAPAAAEGVGAELGAAREAFLNLIADATKWEEEVDGDFDGVTVTYEIRTGSVQLEELCDALGIPASIYMETLKDRIDRAAQTPAALAQTRPSPPNRKGQSDEH